MYEVFEHTADLGLRIRAGDLNGLFVEAGKGFASLLVSEPAEVRLTETVEFHLEGDDPLFLFFDWLNELLYTFDTRKLILVDFQVAVDDKGLQATARGETMNASRHRMEHEVKAITYHGLKVQHETDGWLAEVIVDI